MNALARGHILITIRARPVTTLPRSLLVCGNSYQIGRDEGLPDYVAAIVGVFAKLQRVLHPDGTVWLNVGDAYISGNRRDRAPDRKNRARAMQIRPPTPAGLKPKDLIGVPWRLALTLQDAGWWLRQEGRAGRGRTSGCRPMAGAPPSTASSTQAVWSILCLLGCAAPAPMCA